MGSYLCLRSHTEWCHMFQNRKGQSGTLSLPRLSMPQMFFENLLAHQLSEVVQFENRTNGLRARDRLSRIGWTELSVYVLCGL
jgi:hypothetical protein